MTYPSYTAGQAAKLAHRSLSAALAAHDVGLGHFAVLAALQDFGRLSQKDLATHVDLDTSHMVAFVDRLEGRALVTRHRSTSDRRRYAVAITASGQQLLAELHELSRNSQDEVFGALTERERATLTRLLRKTIESTD